MDQKIRWGLLGAGEIVNRWMKGARQLEDTEIAAVSSRTRETAEMMASRWDIPRVMSYDEMVSCGDIDVVYIPVPHAFHKELAIKAMEKGKAVLVEKPAAVNADEFREMMECARKNNVFLMEAVWTRFFPLIKEMQSIISSGAIGDVRMVKCDFSCRIADDYRGRLVDPAKGGGGLLDTGVYNLHFAQLVYHKNPVKLIGLASSDTDALHLKVDEQAAYIGHYDRGELAVMCSGIRTKMIDTAYVYGTKGYMVIPGFWSPTHMSVNIDGMTEERTEPVPQKNTDYKDEGFQFEIGHVNDCLRKGRKESPVMRWDDSLQILTQCDQLRNSWG